MYATSLIENSRFERPQGQTWLQISNRCSSVSYLKRASTLPGMRPGGPTALSGLSPACVLALRFCMLLHLTAAILVEGVSSSPRITLGATKHLRRHQSDVCCDLRIQTLDMPASLDMAVPTNMACHWGVLERLFVLSLTVDAPAAVSVSMLYWPYTYVSTQAYVLQSSAVALLLLEVMLSRAPFISYHWQVWLLFCSAYVVVIHAAVTDKWLCARLDWSNASSILLYISQL
ncbi:hypothetical protein WJX77_005445 [Trebouxia sp. C0004]